MAREIMEEDGYGDASLWFELECEVCGKTEGIFWMNQDTFGVECQTCLYNRLKDIQKNIIGLVPEK